MWVDDVRTVLSYARERGIRTGGGGHGSAAAELNDRRELPSPRQALSEAMAEAGAFADG